MKIYFMGRYRYTIPFGSRTGALPTAKNINVLHTQLNTVARKQYTDGYYKGKTVLLNAMREFRR